MYWQEEDKNNDEFVVPDDVVDVAFSIECRALPVDHASALSAAIREVLPWFTDEEGAGLHLIHGGDSGNGWVRPSEAGDLLYLSRRTRLVLRLPKHHVDNAQSLTGHTLNIAGHTMTVGSSKVVKLSLTPTLYARYVVTTQDESEERFIADSVAALRGLGVQFKKVMAGMQHSFVTPEGPMYARSLMVADLSYQDAILLQERGIGPHRVLGCGLFIPHKSIKKV